MKATIEKLGYFLFILVIALSASTALFGKPNEKFTKTVSKSFASTPQTVSYTHLDVYKRQQLPASIAKIDSISAATSASVISMLIS